MLSMKGLIIRSPYIDLILDGKKKWEIRGSNTNIRGKIALIKSGSKKIYGEVNLVDSFEIDLDLYNEYHINMYGRKVGKLPYKRTFAWVLNEPVKYKESINYNHPQGAVIWVNL